MKGLQGGQCGWKVGLLARDGSGPWQESGLYSSAVGGAWKVFCFLYVSVCMCFIQLRWVSVATCGI